jgi:hypothetical protein
MYSEGDEVPPEDAENVVVGRHLLAVAIERKLSRSLEVSGDSKDTVSFRCGPRRGLAVIDQLTRLWGYRRAPQGFLRKSICV